MPAHRIALLLKPGILLMAPLVLTGCLFPDNDGFQTSGSGSRGVSLSQAMQSSASGSKEPLHGSSGSSRTYTSVDVDANASGSSSDGGGLLGGLALVSYDNHEYGYQLPVDVAYSVPLGGQILSLTRFTLTPVSFETEHNFLGLYVSGDLVDLRPGSLPDQGIKNTWMFELGMAYRYYFSPAHAFVSPYLSFNAALQSLEWDYRSPVYVGSDTVTSDSLTGIGGYGGVGVAFNRNSRLSFFAEAGFGGTVFMTQTTQGFDNDVFNNFGYFSVKVGLSVKF